MHVAKKLLAATILSTSFLTSACAQEPAEVVLHNTTSQAVKTSNAAKNPYKVTVQAGETLYSIARNNNVEIRDLIEANNLRPPYALISGQTVKLPKASFHTVGDGDTLYAISRSYGVDISQLASRNHIEPPYNIAKGQKLYLPSHAVTGEETVFAAKSDIKYDYSTRSSEASFDDVESSELAPLGSNNNSVTSKSLSDSKNLSAGEDDDNPFAPAVISKETGKAAAAGVSDAEPLVTGGKESTTAKVFGEDFELAQKKIAVPTPIAQKSVSGNLPVPFLKSQAQKASISEQELKPIAEPEKLTATAEKTDNIFAEPVKGDGIESGKVSFNWPAKGKVISNFGPKNGGLYNDGINISAKQGAPITAAEDGSVVYAGNELRGYGNMLLVKHNNGYLTSYAHAEDISVKKGDVVKKGQTIAHVGRSGHVSSPQLHFSIRQGRKALDPEKFLPVEYGMN